MIEIVCATREELIEFGKKIGKVAETGLVIAFRGGLGVGKTTLSKGIALGMGINAVVTSPTYTLINEYSGVLNLYHFDAYRLSSVDEFRDIDCDRYFYGDGVCLVEWSEKVESLLPNASVVIDISINEDNSRSIKIYGAALEAALQNCQ